MGATRPVKVESAGHRGRNTTLNQSHSSQSSINRSRGSQQSQSQSVQGGRKTRTRHRMQAISEESENSDSEEQESSARRNRRASSPGPASSKIRSQRPRVNSESEESGSDSNLPKPKGKVDTKTKPGKTRRAEPELSEEEEDSLVVEFVKKGVSYLWFTLSTNAPVKRADFTRTIFPEGKRLYNRVVTDAQKHLKEIFGMNLLAYNDQTHETSDDIVGQRFPCFIMTSTLKVFHVMQRNVYFESKVGLDIGIYEKEGTTRALLFMYLGLIFMKGLDPGVDENSMWQIMESMEFNEILGVQQADFRKFLKTEYISSLYLTSKESKDDQGTLINVHYFWGPRSHLECSKWDIFARVVKMLPGNKKTLDFPAQMQIILNSPEKDRAIEEANKELEDPIHPSQDQGESDSDSSDPPSDAKTESDTE